MTSKQKFIRNKTLPYPVLLFASSVHIAPATALYPTRRPVVRLDSMAVGMVASCVLFGTRIDWARVLLLGFTRLLTVMDIDMSV